MHKRLKNSYKELFLIYTVLCTEVESNFLACVNKYISQFLFTEQLSLYHLIQFYWSEWS